MTTSKPICHFCGELERVVVLEHEGFCGRCHCWWLLGPQWVPSGAVV